MTSSVNLNSLLQQAESLISNVKDGEYIANEFSRSHLHDEVRAPGILSSLAFTPERHYSHHGSVQNEIKAARLLGNKAAWLELPPNLSEKLESLNVLDSLKPVTTPGKDIFDAFAVDVTDMSTFLKNERENSLLAVIESTRKSTLEASDKARQSAMDHWWLSQKQIVIHQLAGDATSGLDQIPDVLTLVRDTSMNESKLGNKIVGVPAVSNLNQMELAYAKQVDAYLHQERLRLENVNAGDMTALYPSLREYSNNSTTLFKGTHICDYLGAAYLKNPRNADAIDSSNSFVKKEKSTFDIPVSMENFQEISEVWRIVQRLSTLSDSHESLRTSPSAVLLRRDNSNVQKELIQLALAHLESEYTAFVRSVVQSAPREARLGGIPGTRALAKAFLTLHILPGLTNAHNGQRRGAQMMVTAMPPELEDGLVDGRPVWPMLFVCLRCGDFKAALSIAAEFRAALGDFVDYLEEYIQNNRRLCQESKSRIRVLYKRSIKPSSDPYKRLLYCLVGACEPSDNHSEVTNSIDDFLWLKLNQLDQESQADLTFVSSQYSRMGERSVHAQDYLALPQLQKLLLEEYGESHFEAANQPLLFFKVLLLTQQYESAIGFLSRFESLRAHSLHIALVLYEMGLLLVSFNPQVQMVSVHDTDAFRRLNLTRLILMYTRKFETHELRDACNYFFFLKSIPASLDTSTSFQKEGFHDFGSATSTFELTMFHQTLTELIMQSKEYNLFFGQLNAKGKRRIGLMDAFASEINIDQLIHHVGQTLQKRGYLEDAWLMFELCGKWDDAVVLANQLLTQQLLHRPSTHFTSVISQPTDHQRTERIIGHAEKLAQYLHQLGKDSSQGQAYTPTVAQSTLFHLLDVCQFFALHAAGDWVGCLKLMDSLRLLPSDNSKGSVALGDKGGFDEIEARVRDFSTRFPEEITRLIPQLLLATMQTICELWKMAKNAGQSSKTGDSSISGTMQRSTLSVDELKIRATALLTFAGRINYRMPGDVYNKMFQMEREMI